MGENANNNLQGCPTAMGQVAQRRHALRALGRRPLPNTPCLPHKGSLANNVLLGSNQRQGSIEYEGSSRGRAVQQHTAEELRRRRLRHRLGSHTGTHLTSGGVEWYVLCVNLTHAVQAAPGSHRRTAASKARERSAMPSGPDSRTNHLLGGREGHVPRTDSTVWLEL